MIFSPDRYAQVFALVFAEANSSKKPDIWPDQMSGAISGHSLHATDEQLPNFCSINKDSIL